MVTATIVELADTVSELPTAPSPAPGPIRPWAMTSRDFCYWLQGYFEISGQPLEGFGREQVAAIQRHLAMVFVHEIDPSMGPPAHQEKLNEAHGLPPGTKIGGGPAPGGGLYRC